MYVSVFPMIPLLFEDTVELEDADYILYSHQYARVEDMSRVVLEQLHYIDEHRRPDAEIIVVGKACNAEQLLDGSIKNITFWDNHYAAKVGEKFGRPDITDEYFVYDSERHQLYIWPVNGCLQKCKFCRRSYMHIPFESIPMGRIKERLDWYKANEPEKLEYVTLRAENLTEYGIDLCDKQLLSELIDLISSYDEVKKIWVYIGMMIGEISDAILGSICKSKKFAHISLNLEAGTDRLLKTIGKNHTCERAIYVTDKIREAIPDISLATNIMVGLPTETWEDLDAAAELCLRTGMTSVSCLIYDSAPGQPLAALPQLSPEVQWYHSQTFIKWLKQKKLASGNQAPLLLNYRKQFRHGSRKAAHAKAEEQYWLKEYAMLTWWITDEAYLPQIGGFIKLKCKDDLHDFWYYRHQYFTQLCDNESPSA